MDCETDVYQNGYCSVYPYFLFIKISQSQSFKYGDTISCFHSWPLHLIYSMCVAGAPLWVLSCQRLGVLSGFADVAPFTVLFSFIKNVAGFGGRWTL